MIGEDLVAIRSEHPGKKYLLPISSRQPFANGCVIRSRTLDPMPQNPTSDRSQVIFMGGVISAVLAVVLLMLAYVPM